MKPTITNGTYFRTEGLSQKDYEFLVGKMVEAGFDNPYDHGGKHKDWEGWTYVVAFENRILGSNSESNEYCVNEITAQDFKDKQNVKYKKLDLTIREKIERLMAKEVFYNYNGVRKYVFDEKAGLISAVDSENYAPLDITIDFYTPATWEDEVGEVSEDNPVLCWVNNVDYRKRTVAAMLHRVKKDDDYPYVDCRAMSWKYATPVKPQECYGYEE